MKITKQHYQLMQMLIKRKCPDIKISHPNHWLNNDFCCLLCNQNMNGSDFFTLRDIHFLKHFREYNLLSFI